MSPTGVRIILKDNPKDDQHRTLTVGPPLIEFISADCAERCSSRGDVRFPSTLRPGAGPLSRNTFRTKVRLPTLKQMDLSFRVGVDDLRHAQASWLLAGGADLRRLSSLVGSRRAARGNPSRAGAAPLPGTQPQRAPQDGKEQCDGAVVSGSGDSRW